MIWVSEIKTAPPEEYKNELQKSVYETLERLSIPFERVDNDEALTMEDCIAIDKALSTKTAKALFLCNRQKTNFYLFVTAGDKPFVTKDFGKALEISRVSFAPPEIMLDMLGTIPGCASILSVLKDGESRVKLVIDKEVISAPEFASPDCTTTGYIKIGTDDILNKYLPETGHKPIIIEV